MLGIGFQELVLILVVAVVVVGPKKLPDLAKSLGKGLQEFKKATEDITSSLHENETFKDLQGIKSSVQDTMASLKPAGLLDSDIKPSQPAPELKKFEAPETPAATEAPAQTLEPKKPEENLEGRIVLMDGIVSEHHQPGDETPAPAPAEAAPAKAATSAPTAQPSEAPKKTDA